MLVYAGFEWFRKILVELGVISNRFGLFFNAEERKG